MSTFDYPRSQDTAQRLIDRFGAPGQIWRATTTGPAYNPTKGEPAKYDVSLVVTDYSRSEVDGSRVLQTDRKVLIPAKGLPIEPTLSDELHDSNGKRLNVIDIRPLKPAGTVVYYEMQVRA